MFRTKTNIVLTLLVVLAWAGVGYYYVTHKNSASAEAGQDIAMEQQQQQAMPVSAIKAEFQPVKIWNDYSARLEPVNFAEIRPQVSGVITEVKFEDGQPVEQGDVLFVIDPRPFEAAVNQAQAEVDAAVNQQQLSKKEANRARELIKSDAISKRVVDERESAVKIANANIATAKARLDRAKIDLDYAYVKAPISGRVGREEVMQGNLVGAGPNAPLLTSIIAIDEVYADFEVDERTYINYIRSNAKDRAAESQIPVKLVLDNDDVEYEGFIQSFDNQINTQTGTIRARALFDNKDNVLLPGMFARVKIGSAQMQNEILIPEKAISTDQDRKFVYVVNGESKVEYRAVKLGESLKGQRVIKSGLEEGDRVITEGIIRLRPGMPVSPQIKLNEAQ